MAGELAEHGHGGLEDAVPRDDEPDDARAVLGLAQPLQPKPLLRQPLVERGALELEGKRLAVAGAAVGAAGQGGGGGAYFTNFTNKLPWLVPIQASDSFV